MQARRHPTAASVAAHSVAVAAAKLESPSRGRDNLC